MLLLMGKERKDIPDEWGITPKALERKLSKWEVLNPLDEDLALITYGQSLPTSKTEVTEIMSVSAEPAAEIAIAESKQTDLYIWLKIPVVNVNQSFSNQRIDVEQAIDELDIECQNYRGRDRVVTKALRVMFALTSAMYLDMAELLTPDQAVKKLRQLVVQTNHDYLADIKRQAEANNWKVFKHHS